MNTKLNEKFGFWTTVALVVGIVIGSGIFFKADDILISTDGNLLVGTLLFVFVGIGVIFGAITIATYAHEEKVEGGIVKYCENALGKRFAFSVGWFQAVAYFPALIAILAYVFGIYTAPLFGIETNSLGFWIFVICSYLFTVITNFFSYKFGGAVQIVTTVIKFVPLIIIAFCGLFLAGIFNDSATTYSSIFAEGLSLSDNANVFTGLIAVAFTFDGWIIATSISGEVKNSKKILPLALVLGTLVIMAIYFLYFLGISRLVGIDQVIAAGDEHVSIASEMIFHSKMIIPVFVSISVYGGLNGMALASFRLFHSLVSNDYMKDSINIIKVNKQTNISTISALLMVPLVLFYFIIQYITTIEGGFLNSIAFDISSMPVIINYIIYTILFIGIIPKIKKGEISSIYYLYIAIACFVSVIVILGSLGNNGMSYIILSLLVILIGQFFYKKSNN